MSDPRTVLGGFAALKVDGVPHDVLILPSGLLLMPNQKQPGSDVKRLNGLVAEVGIEELIRRNRFVRFEDVSHSQVHRRTPLKVDLDLLGGGSMTLAAGWTTPLLTKNSDRDLCDLLAEIPATRPMPADGYENAARAWAEDAMVLDGVANVTANDIPYDLLVFDVGLVLIGEPGPFEKGQERLTKLLTNLPPHEIVGRNWFIRYEEVVDARIVKTLPLRAELELYDGLHLKIGERMVSQTLTDQGRDVLVDAFRSVGADAP
ncbi:hypothetical protein [Cryptosporangium aurantiacum]|uniref:hypothetical protein n=1 Tax=Cryptosporangium aurantiacum TaxID=134849 RepID=UPI000932702C|nr:hypothetical protein [Cryptosporangium aurantiacum]